jgi:hypothetical protein
MITLKNSTSALTAVAIISIVFFSSISGASAVTSATCTNHMKLCQAFRKARHDMSPSVCMAHFRDCMKTGIWIDMKGHKWPSFKT